MTFVDEISARPPTLQEADELGMAEGTAVFVIRKVALDGEGKVVDITDAVLPADRTELVYTIPLPAWK